MLTGVSNIYMEVYSTGELLSSNNSGYENALVRLNINENVFRKQIKVSHAKRKGNDFGNDRPNYESKR